MQKTLRQWMNHLDHIEQGGEFARVRDLVTGRIVNEAVTADAKKWPTTDAEIRAFQRANPPLKVDGMIGQQTLARLEQSGYTAPKGFVPVGNKGAKTSGDTPDEPVANTAPQPDAVVPNTSGNSQFSTIDPATQGGWAAINAKTKAQKNPNGNGGHDGSGIDPNADPENPKLWPAGVTKAPDFGYLDAEGMWIPTPFHFRNEEGKWRIPKNSPANLIGIQRRHLTSFQQKVQQMQDKVVYLSSAAIELQKPVQLPGGAPQIPGYRQIDASRFSTDAREPGINKTLDWIYAYQKGKNIILIASMLFPNMKISIGRYYRGWEDYIGNIRSNGPIKTDNGTIYVSGLMFNYNDVFFDVVIHSTDPDVGPQILQTIKI